MRSFASKALAFSFIAVLFFPLAARADTLTLSPASGSYSVGKTIPVTVYVSSPSQSVNAISGTLLFPTDKLQVVSVSKTGSVLSLWVSEPTYSNTAGTVTFEGVVPNPGYIGSSGKIVTVNFKVVGQGSATVRWSTGSILANDGSGTNILKNLLTSTFALGGALIPVQAALDVTVNAPAGPVVTSKEFPSSKVWYPSTSGTFSWKLSDNISAVRTLVGKLPDSVPSIVYDPPIGSKSIDSLDDGVWYFHLQEKIGDTWGHIMHYQFRVDTTPPESFVIKERSSDDPTDPTPAFDFAASDSTSGIDHYVVTMDDGEAQKWTDDGSGIYTAPALGPGKHSLLAKAYDEAGNNTPASLDFTIIPIEGPKVNFFSSDVKDGGVVIVRGTAPAGMKVEVVLTKTGTSHLASVAEASTDSSATQIVTTGESGVWNAALDSSKIESGAYDLTAATIDIRGARSKPVSAGTVLVNASWWQSLGSSALKMLALAVPLIALAILLVSMLMRGLHHIRKTNRKFRTEMRSELRDIDNVVEKAFDLLRSDIEDSVRLLERTKSRRRLTGEEEAIIERFKENLRDARKVIGSKVHKTEKELD